MRIIGAEQYIGEDVQNCDAEQVRSAESQQDLQEIGFILGQVFYEPALKQNREK